ncbi:MAG: CsgG/HfaB family protein [Spirochaetota bacterium]|nr:CsgG/HfaB family protein [Spirochaetota bacterium]
MRKFVILLIGVTAYICACVHADSTIIKRQAISKIKRVAIIPLKSSDAITWDSIADSLSMYLMRTNLEIIDRQILEKLLKEQNMTMAGIIDNPNLAVGKLKGVDALIYGNVKVVATHEKSTPAWKQCCSCLTLYIWTPAPTSKTTNYASFASAKLIDIQNGVTLMIVTYECDSAKSPKSVAKAMAKEFYKVFNIKAEFEK